MGQCLQFLRRKCEYFGSGCQVAVARQRLLGSGCQVAVVLTRFSQTDGEAGEEKKEETKVEGEKKKEEEEKKTEEKKPENVRLFSVWNLIAKHCFARFVS